MANKDACLTIPTQSSDYSAWIEWHKALKKCVGKSNANQLWLLNYEKEQVGDNYELRDYMSSQGVQLDRDAWERLTDWGGGVYNWGAGVLNFANYTTMAVVIIILGGAGLMIYNIAKSTDADKAMRIGAAVGTRGMSEIGGGSTKQITG